MVVVMADETEKDVTSKFSDKLKQRIAEATDQYTYLSISPKVFN